MTVITSRKLIRLELASLLRGGLADLLSERVMPDGTTAPAVYSGQVLFGKKRAAVTVSSAGGLPYPLAVKTVIGRYDISIDVFVIYADDTDRDNPWDEEDAESLLDEISDRVMNIITENQRGENYKSLDWEIASDTTPINIGGIDFRREQIILKPS